VKKIEDPLNGLNKVEVEFNKGVEQLPKGPMLDPDYDDYNDEEKEKKERYYLYLADELGFIKLWDLTHMLESCEFEVVTPYIERRN